MTSEFVALESITSDDKSYCGGKGAMLGQLMRLDLKGKPTVPTGGVVTTVAFERWLNTGGVKDANLTKALDTVGKDVTEIEKLSKILVDKMKDVPVPECTVADIKKYDGDWSTKWAARSSAVGEDGEVASFAGQHDSYLNLTSFDKLIDGVRNVWLSSFNPRALYYRVLTKNTAKPIRHAVVLQRMVDAELAGVAFSIDPRTGVKNHGLIEYVNGLGDKLVDGSTNPTLVQFVHGKPLITNVPAVRATAETVLELQDKLGWPVDMEWAWKEDGLFLLQARPITSLPEALAQDKATALMLEHAEYGTPYVVGETLAVGEVFAKGYITRKQAKALLANPNYGTPAWKGFKLHFRILVVPFTSPLDVPLMEKVRGIIVSKGGALSHAAIFCREFNKPCIKVKSLDALKHNNTKFESSPIFMDGNRGAVYKLTALQASKGGQLNGT